MYFKSELLLKLLKLDKTGTNALIWFLNIFYKPCPYADLCILMKVI